MSHAVHEKQKLLNRIRRIRGQVDATEQAIEAEENCAAVMHQLVACRGAINSLLAEVLEDHVREHLIGGTRSKTQVQAADELIDIAHAYFRS
jgi:DNA-binding FrmR family transcriptional regulator